MNLAPTPAQIATRDLARAFADEQIRVTADARDRERDFPDTLLRSMAAVGLMSVNLPERWGGLAAGVVAYSLAVTEIARADASVAVTMAVNNMVAEVLEAFGTPAQKQAHLASMCRGTYSSGSFCLSEPGAGSDPSAMRTRAERTPDGWILNGTKAWITSGAYAGVFIVWAQTKVDGEDRITAFLVDPSTPGISVGKPETKTGQHSSNTVSLTFDDVHLADDSILGELGGGFTIAMVALDGGRIGVASQALGIGLEAVDLAQHHLRSHTPANTRDKSRELSRCLAELEAARGLVLRAAWMKQQRGLRFTREASMAKLYSSEAAWNACTTALKVAGLAANDRSLDLERFLRDCRVTRIYEGTSEIQRVVIARDLLRNGVKTAAI